MNKKIKVLVLGDSPLSPSGVGIQTNIVIRALLDSGKFKVVALAGAIKHMDYRPIKVQPYEDDWIVHPVDGYGTPDQIRSILRSERPDILWFMTDPRFWGWLWQMEDEIRPLLPMVYYHVWDNMPIPTFNQKYYDSTDVVVSISQLTNRVLRETSSLCEVHHIPHTMDSNIFKTLSESEVSNARYQSFPEDKKKKKTTFLWDSRNARRKQSGSIIFWFKDFLDEVGHDAARLIMHTDPKDPHGQDLEKIMKFLKLDSGQVLLSVQKLPFENMSVMYNLADCLINVSDAEGFGLSVMSALFTGTPVICTMTGGMVDQIMTEEGYAGIPLFPASKSIIGSQEIPWIHEDRLAKEDVVSALKQFHFSSDEQRKEWGLRGQRHMLKNFGYEDCRKKWVDLMLDIHERHGSWDSRKLYSPYRTLTL